MLLRSDCHEHNFQVDFVILLLGLILNNFITKFNKLDQGLVEPSKQLCGLLRV